MVVAPELAAGSGRRPAEPLLEEREGEQRVLPFEDDLAERRRVGRDEVGERDAWRVGDGGVQPRLQPRPAERAHGVDPFDV